MNIQDLKKAYEEKDVSMFGSKNIENSLAMLYHENSKFTSYSSRRQGEQIGVFNNPYVIERSSQPYKIYAGMDKIDLSIYKQKPEVDLFKVISERRSVREYDSNYKISLNELAVILYNSYGVTSKMKIAKEFGVRGHLGLRNIPSAGGLYPSEIYVVIFNAHIPPGLYHYRPDINSLEVIRQGLFIDELLKYIQAEPYVNMRSSSGIIITTGILERVCIKYGERGYRFMLQESGIIGQMISILAQSLNLGSCWLGGYEDDKVNDFLMIDGVYEMVNNIIVIGKQKNDSYE